MRKGGGNPYSAVQEETNKKLTRKPKPEAGGNEEGDKSWGMGGTAE